MEASKGLQEASQEELTRLAKQTLEDLGLRETPTRLERSRLRQRLMQQIDTTGTKDRQLLAALGTLTKQAEAIYESLRQEAKENPAAPPTQTPPTATAPTESSGPRMPVGTVGPTDDWGTPVRKVV